MIKSGMKKLLPVFFFAFLVVQVIGITNATADKLHQGYEPISLFNDRLRVSGSFDTEVKWRFHMLKNKSGVHVAETHARKSRF